MVISASSRRILYVGCGGRGESARDNEQTTTNKRLKVGAQASCAMASAPAHKQAHTHTQSWWAFQNEHDQRANNKAWPVKPSRGVVC